MKNIELIYAKHNLNYIASGILPSVIRYYELTLLVKGSLEYSVDGSRVSLEAGDCIFIRPGSRRSRRGGENHSDYVSFNFISSDEIKLPEIMKNAASSDVMLLIAAFDRINRRVYLDNKEKNEHLLACIISVLEDRDKVESLSPLSRKIMEYIEANLKEKITLKKIAEETFFSPIYCEKVFKTDTGKSIIEYLLDRRIDEAKKLIIEGSLPLSVIAEQLGFCDYNYFSRAFKARSGYSPTAYKKLSP